MLNASTHLDDLGNEQPLIMPHSTISRLVYVNTFGPTYTRAYNKQQMRTKQSSSSLALFIFFADAQQIRSAAAVLVVRAVIVVYLF